MPNRRNEKGSVLVIVAVGLTAFLVLAGFVVDVGFLYYQRALLVNTVDAAALAGVQELPSSPYYAREKASDYARLNLDGLQDQDIRIEFSSHNHAISVTATKDAQLFFLRILGINTARVSARAKALVGMVSGYNDIVPLGVVDQEFENGQQYYLKLGSGTEPGNYQGNFGALALGGTGASDYEENLAEGYKDFIRIGDWLPTEPGNMSGPTRAGIAERIGRDPYTSFENADIRSPRVVVVPVIESLDVPGRSEVKVVRFAAFYLDSYLEGGKDSGSKDDFVLGRFLRLVVDGEVGESSNLELRAFRLVE